MRVVESVKKFFKAKKETNRFLKRKVLLSELRKEHPEKEALKEYNKIINSDPEFKGARKIPRFGNFRPIKQIGV